MDFLRMKKGKLFLLTLLSILLVACSNTSLKKGEMVVFFPTSASQNKNKNSWDFKIHGWVFEKEEQDLSRRLLQKLFKESFEGVANLKDGSEQLSTLKQRLKWFLVDNKRNKKLTVKLDNQPRILEKTAANGHSVTPITLNKRVKNPQWLSYKVEDKYQRNFTGEVQLIPEEGLSVISDIDDTIKDSNVLDKKKLLLNTFLNVYRVTDGFPEYYKKLKNKGAFFHYVSASPWQLYPSLKPFMEKNYPKGTISLRNFRVKDSSLLAFFKPSKDYKIAKIKSIIKQYPKHQFILIGDSGEHDPEVYAEIYKLFPNNIKAIQIRAVEGSDLTKARFLRIFKQVPRERWMIFAKPSSD